MNEGKKRYYNSGDIFVGYKQGYSTGLYMPMNGGWGHYRGG